MKQNCITNNQTIGEEIANSALHFIGALLGILGLVFLVNNARSSLPVYVIFASTMIFMFSASTAYHAIIPARIKYYFRIVDHQAIYIFIAGTYTPFCLLALKGTLGWALFCFEWVLALTGVILSAVQFRFIKKIEMIIFILMGWAIIGGCIPLARSLSLQSIVLLFAGGVAYTAGTFWYRAGKPRPSVDKGNDPAQNDGQRQPRNRLFCGHVIWHLCVLAGAACHWFSVWFLCKA
jgi:hemolysin III